MYYVLATAKNFKLCPSDFSRNVSETWFIR